MADAERDTPKTERRGRVRAATLRQAMFSAFDRGLLGQGTVVDISADGLQIHSRLPQEVGRELDVDIYPKSGGDHGVLHSRVRVVNVRKLENGEWAMGMLLLTKLPMDAFHPSPIHFPKAVPAPPSKPEAAPIPEALPTILFRAAAEPAAQPVSRRQAALLAALVFCFFCLLFRACHPLPSARTGGIAPKRNSVQRAVAGASGLDKAYTLLERGKAEEARKLFAELARNSANPPTDRFIARLGEAEAAAQTGQKQQALELLSGLERIPGAPTPWIHAARQYAQRLGGRSKSIAGPIAAMRDPLPIESEPPSSATMELPSSPLQIIVDKSDHTIEIVQNGKSIAAFPIGLGEHGATPEGQFRISAKIVHPDWNDRGRRVKAGDPENPLGGQWIGLENQQGPTPYGIHPTSDADSIGKDRSRGCIRVRPEDAKEIYRLCPVGTPVLIRN